jgi:hypothetical protein
MMMLMIVHKKHKQLFYVVLRPMDKLIEHPLMCSLPFSPPYLPDFVLIRAHNNTDEN